MTAMWTADWARGNYAGPVHDPDGCVRGCYWDDVEVYEEETGEWVEPSEDDLPAAEEALTIAYRER